MPLDKLTQNDQYRNILVKLLGFEGKKSFG